jgi:hypothetical protein
MGLNDEPDNVPQADGVKLCDPTYAQPAAGSTTWISSSVSSSVSEKSSSCRFLDENGLSCNIAIIIFAQIILERVPHVYERMLPLNASIPARLYFWNHKIGFEENFWRSTAFADKRLFHPPEIRTSGKVLSIKMD